MKKARKSRPRSFSPAFDSWLRWCESHEDHIHGRRNKPKEMVYHEDFFVLESENLDTLASRAMGAFDLIGSWVTLAKHLRSAMKFRFVYPSLVPHPKNPNEEVYTVPVYIDTPIALPFPLTYVEVDIGPSPNSPGENKVMLLLEERYSNKVPDHWTERYTAAGMLPGEKFICVSLAAYNPSGVKYGDVKDPLHKLSILPCEIHIPLGPLFTDGYCNLGRDGEGVIVAFPGGVDGSGFMEHYMDTTVGHITVFLSLVHGPRTQRITVPGLPREAQELIKKHRRKPMESTFYEHHVLEIPINPDPPIEVGRHGVPGSRKRLHAVRSHVRHYAKPLKSGPNKGQMSTIIPSQWRGDEKIGVVTKDYDFIPPERDDEEDE